MLPDELQAYYRELVGFHRHNLERSIKVLGIELVEILVVAGRYKLGPPTSPDSDPLMLVNYESDEKAAQEMLTDGTTYVFCGRTFTGDMYAIWRPDPIGLVPSRYSIYKWLENNA